jgi:hypothetical protein
MSVTLVTYGSDRRCELAAAEAIRKPIYAENWNTIRLGLQFSYNGVAANITGTPIFAFGVCKDFANVLVASTSDHVVGMRPNVATFTNNTGPPSYFSLGATAWQSFKRVGSTITTAVNANASNCFLSNATTIRNGIFLEIVKGSPNYTLKLAVPITSGAAQSDLTDTEFLAIMELGSLANVATVKANYSATLPTGTLAVDQGTNGILNHIFVYWERSANKFSFNIRHRLVA